MARIIWDNKYTIGVAEIDQQHQRLCELFNTINQAMETGAGVDVYNDAVVAMLDYAKIHFKNEEILMTEANFEGLQEHLDEHENFFQQAKQFEAKSDTKRDVYETIKIVNFLWDWFLNHIQKTDRKYLPIINK